MDRFKNSTRSHTILIINVTWAEYHTFQKWVDEHSWRDGIGRVLFPQNREAGTHILVVDSGSFSGTWWNDILPAIYEYFGRERIIYAKDE